MTDPLESAVSSSAAAAEGLEEAPIDVPTVPKRVPLHDNAGTFDNTFEQLRACSA